MRTYYKYPHNLKSQSEFVLFNIHKKFILVAKLYNISKLQNVETYFSKYVCMLLHVPRNRLNIMEATNCLPLLHFSLL